jgi:prepilin-type N-terminal cleavage/methylation domain-containing protein
MAGFALVEVLVAAAILAGLSAMYMRSVAANASAARMVEARRGAILVAQSALEQAGIPDSRLPAAGRSGRYDWTIAIAPQPGAATGAVRLERVEVRVFEAGETAPLVTLATLRIGR